MKVLRYSWLALFTLLAGCVSDEGPIEFLPQTSNLSSYFAVRDPGKKLVYDNHSFLNGDTLQWTTVEEYIGRPRSLISADGYAPIDIFEAVDSSTGQIVHNEVFISDTQVVEYGKSCKELGHKFTRFDEALRVGSSWYANNAYQLPDSTSVSVLARVEGHPVEVQVGSKVYSDVFIISYLSIGGSAEPGINNPLRQFIPGTKEVIYYAKGVGLILRLVYGRDGTTIIAEQKLKGITD